MNPDRDLAPLLFRPDTPAPVRDALATARAGLPTSSQLARLAARLPLSPNGPGGPGAPPPAGDPGAPPPPFNPGGAPGTPSTRPSVPNAPGAPAAPGAPQATAPWLFPGVMCGVAVGIVIAGAIAAFSPSFHRAPSRLATPALTAQTSTLGSSGAGVSVPSGLGSSADGQGASPGLDHPGNEPVPGAPAADIGSSNGASVGSTAPLATASLPVASAAPGGGRSSDAADAAPGGGRGPDAARAASAGGRSSDAAAASIETEAALLQRARQALVSDPSRSLALVEQHRRLYPRGMLSQERELLAVKALVALGRADSARSRADAFVTAYPGSAYRDRVESVARPAPR